MALQPPSYLSRLRYDISKLNELLLSFNLPLTSFALQTERMIELESRVPFEVNLLSSEGKRPKLLAASAVNEDFLDNSSALTNLDLNLNEREIPRNDCSSITHVEPSASKCFNIESKKLEKIMEEIQGSRNANANGKLLAL